MTEEEWLEHEDPVPMLEFVASPTNERKLRLFLCACSAHVLKSAAQCHNAPRRGWSECMGMIESALRTVEHYADGLCGTRVLETARRYTREAIYVPSYIDYGGESGLDSEALVVEGAATRLLTLESIVCTYRWALNTIGKHCRVETGEEADASFKPLAEYKRDAAGWLRDVVGNPFRSARVDPFWLTWNEGTVERLAHIIYDTRTFRDLPILADALEEAGCANADILGHCRGPDLHVCGCWVLDLLIEAPRRFLLAAASPEPEEATLPPPVPTRPQLRPGDWLCPVCNAHNFARRETCLRCNRSRPKPELREGDWICPNCKAHNFSRRQCCHQCKVARLS